MKKTITAEKEKRSPKQKTWKKKIKQAELKASPLESARKAQEESARKQNFRLGGKISQTKTYSLSSIISQWRPLIANVECQFKYSDTGRLYQTSSGSGIAIKKFDLTLSAILTNKHVLTDSNGYRADSCSAKLLDSSESTGIFRTLGAQPKEYDLGYIYINNPSVTISKTSLQTSLLFGPQKPFWATGYRRLGYPSIGH